jgi:hypothetical protein
MYYKSNQEALKEFKNKCKNIACDFEKKDAFVYSLNRSDKISKECEILDKINESLKGRN